MEIMNHIDNVILDYVKAQDTDYAIIIDGQWGVGKSFYWRHAAKPTLNLFIEVVLTFNLSIN